MGKRFGFCGRWISNTRDYSLYISGATNPEYVITADDVDKLIVVECIPMDDQGRQEMVRYFANDTNTWAINSFLRQRYKHLTQDQGLGTPPEMMRFPESGDLRVSSKVNSKRKMQTGLRFPRSCLDLNRKSTMSNEKEAMGNLTGGLGKKQQRNKGNNENEVCRIPMSHPNINQTEKTCKIDGNTSGISKVPVFDLNEISREEVESQAIAEDMDNMVVDIGSEELQGEIKLSIYRNVKKGLNKGVLRKVTWQDPVALRV